MVYNENRVFERRAREKENKLLKNVAAFSYAF
jgi:hypothetical protein